MRLHELADSLDLRELTPATCGDSEISRGYASELLSDILAHAPAGGVLVTCQAHSNVISAAALAGLSAIVFSCGAAPDAETLHRATTEGIPLFGTDVDSFEMVGRLYEAGLRGGTPRRPAADNGPAGRRGRHARSWEAHMPWLAPQPDELAELRCSPTRIVGAGAPGLCLAD